RHTTNYPRRDDTNEAQIQGGAAGTGKISIRVSQASYVNTTSERPETIASWCADARALQCPHETNRCFIPFIFVWLCGTADKFHRPRADARRARVHIADAQRVNAHAVCSFGNPARSAHTNSVHKTNKPTNKPANHPTDQPTNSSTTRPCYRRCGRYCRLQRVGR